MNWLNLRVSDMAAEPLLSATAEQVGIWVRLSAYCAERENGGMIRDCVKWSDAAWQRAAGVKREDLAKESPLWWWKDSPFDGLGIALYPVDQESIMKSKRVGGKRGANSRWKPKNVSDLPTQKWESH